MSKSKRWSVKVSKEKIAPAGTSEALAEAKRQLGRLEPLHVGDQVCRCEKCTETRITELARRYNKLKLAAKGAPRAVQVSRNLEEVATKSRQLATCLSSLDDYTRHWISTPRDAIACGPDARLLYVRATANELPQPSLVEDGDGKFVARLKALSEYARLMADEFKAWSLLNTPFPLKDTGGNTSIVTQWRGTPAELLVIGAYHIYDDFRPGEARKTEDGSFHTFVNQVFLYATGTRKGQSSLFNQIKRLLGPRGVLKIPK